MKTKQAKCGKIMQSILLNQQQIIFNHHQYNTPSSTANTVDPMTTRISDEVFMRVIYNKPMGFLKW